MRSINSIDSISIYELVDELKIRSVVFLLLSCCSSAEDEDDDGDEQLKGNQVCLLSDVPSGLEGVCLSFGRPPRRVQQYCFFQS